MTDRPEMGLCGEPNCEEYWIECSVCGCEFCSKCFPNARMCPDCAEEQGDLIDDEEERDPDFEDVPNLNAIIREVDP